VKAEVEAELKADVEADAHLAQLLQVDSRLDEALRIKIPGIPFDVNVDKMMKMVKKIDWVGIALAVANIVRLIAQCVEPASGSAALLFEGSKEVL
jgi:hypothetical protein